MVRFVLKLCYLAKFNYLPTVTIRDGGIIFTDCKGHVLSCDVELFPTPAADTVHEELDSSDNGTVSVDMDDNSLSTTFTVQSSDLFHVFDALLTSPNVTHDMAITDDAYPPVDDNFVSQTQT